MVVGQAERESTVSARRGGAPPSLSTDAVWQAAEAASAASAMADRSGRLSPDVVDAITDAGFPRYFAPRAQGGGEGAFAPLFDATVGVARGCASAAWCAMLWATHGRFTAFLPDEGRQEVWSRSPDVRIAAAVVPPAGRAVPRRDGWTVTGTWNFASGVEFAHWVLLAAPEAHEGEPEARIFAVPRDAVVVHDTWDAPGLRATGSHTVEAREIFVPAHRSFRFADLVHGGVSHSAARAYAVPVHLPGGVLFSAPALGAAQRALELWTTWAKDGGALRDSAAAQSALTRSAAELDSVQLLLARAAARADAGPTDERAVARNRRDAAVGVELITDAVERLFRATGTQARAGDELARCWRDVHTVASHGALRTEPVARQYARSLD
ncbi:MULTISPECIES: acyl-CoA dehydrogenase family protein [unclassified Streptomyces]|uniref:acyl-CoA dehydrogenase family protein n=1 Tax=unclassified Streptomyces TaxID=2593676 RepID=UPI000E3012C7|nr:acyl-CoA dehydrogenase family protein [Streptomyces sp. AcE210]RFC71512.1 oxidoreductase [Streptomyces sp. AcE210]